MLVEGGRYLGILQLKVSTVAVTALGVVDTNIPGSTGYSFLILITAEFPGIPLGFGFKLSGVGGLVGINRQVAVDVLQRGVQDGSLAAILFPSRESLRNPTGVLAGIQRVFPPTQGQHVVAPMVKLTWGAPTVLEAVIGVVIRFPELLIALLGRISLRLPLFNDNAIVRVNVLVAGLVDPGQKLIDIRASLYDSRIVRYVIAGDMVFRMRWGDAPDFLFSLGGFHPRFQAPAGFPTLRRLSVSIGNDFGARLNVEGFLALTPNTLQLGVKATADVEVAEIFSAHGEVYVYGMITFSPFAFRLDFGVHFSLRRGSTNLLAVHVEGFIEGPGPWRIQGSASISVLFFEVSASFDLRFGAPAAPPAVTPPPDILALLVEALTDAKSWNAELADSARRVVSLGRVEGERTVLDPIGGLTVRQKVVPLRRDIRRFGQIDLPATRTFRITGVQLGGQTLDETQVRIVSEWFAPGQFARLTEAEQLSRESFVPMDAGVSLFEDGALTSATEVVDLGFELLVVPCLDADESEAPPPPETPCGTPLALQRVESSFLFAELDHVARAARQTGGGLDAYTPAVIEPVAVLGATLYGVARTDTLDAVAGLGNATDTHEAHARLDAWLAAHPEDQDHLQVVPLYLTRRAA